MTNDLAKRTQKIRSTANDQIDRYHELVDRWKAERRAWKPDEILEDVL